MIILDLPDLFRTKSPHTYPPFKNGYYLEEYFYKYVLENRELFNTIDAVYIPVYWTNLQVSGDYESKKEYYNEFLKEQYAKYAKDTKYFTIVQHDDCVLLNVPESTIIFGACSGHVPLPLIYEDKNKTLETIQNNNNPEKVITCSFVGSQTHAIRTKLDILKGLPKYLIQTKGWDVNVDVNNANNFISIALHSAFTLAPRGYGRSSFRFFECFLLNTIPIYIYDDVNWLPYQDILDYSKFSIVLHESEMESLPIVLESISIEKQKEMLLEVENHKQYFSLEYMCNYICDTLKKNKTYTLTKGNQTMTFLQ